MTNRVRFDFDGAAVLVTGGTSGIGRDIAEQFTDAAGADVTVTGTRGSAADYDQPIPGAHYRQLDLADRAAVDELATGLERLLVALTWNLARQWANDGIRVNAVAPGVIDTPMTAPLAHLPDLATAELAHIPMGRFGTPEEVARVVAFLASAAADYITGHTVAIDGGYLTL